MEETHSRKWKLPQPHPEDVVAFQKLYRAKFGIELESAAASDLARKIIGIVYVQRCLRTEEACSLSSGKVRQRPGGVDGITLRLKGHDLGNVADAGEGAS